MNKNLELLAPVGSFESLKAAIQNGANAVYLGGKEFSARASANNFDREELIEAVKYAHIRGARVFVTVNTLIKQDEKDDFLEYIKFLYNIQIDALIIQDIGMASIIKKELPDFELHASTQMSAHSLEDVLYLQNMGFTRVVLARELNVDELKYITDNSDVDIEVFVHGALCVCYSGQCLMSSVLGTRSGNRGRCAQPCRQKYQLYNIEEDSYVDTKGQYLLSPRDLNTIENIADIIDSNVLSLKIEGRMKRPEYVATVISAYREAIVNYIENNDRGVDDERLDELYTIFNRKFTHGYILGEVGASVMNSEKPNNRGLYIGKVLSCNTKSKRLKIKLEKSLKKGDGLNVGGGTVGRVLKGKQIKDYAAPGEIVEIDYIGDIAKGTEVFRTSDGDLLDRVRRTYEEDKEYIKIPLKGNITLKLGEKVKLSLEDIDGNRVEVQGDKEVERALKVAISEEKASKQISKMGDTPYRLDEFTSNIEEGVSIPISELNNLRRKAIDSLSDKRVYIDRSTILENYLSQQKKNDVLSKKTDKESLKSESLLVNVSCNKIEQINAIKNMDIDCIYYRDIYSLEDAIDIARKNNKKIVYYMPRIIRSMEKNVYKTLLNIPKEKIEYLEGFRIANYGELSFIKKNYSDKKIFISSWMNVMNDESINYYSERSAQRICLSQEMSMMQIKNLSKDIINKSDIEYLAYGRTEMMISEYCPMGVLTKECSKNKRDAMCKKSTYSLESDQGYKYRLSQDENCRTTIYSDDTVSLLEDLEKLYNEGIGSIEIALSFEKEKEIQEIVEKFIKVSNYASGLDYNIDMKDLNINIDKEFSKGHLYKEID
ncbi:MAG: U32 family peptidase [Peptostreptococcus sp.]|uniref:U32 family peptidase n=1 Tax=Peptostreptococcus sp. TaxID=1262 RepID=UPI002FC9DC59